VSRGEADLREEAARKSGGMGLRLVMR
jgi:hypothetical protein